MQDAGYSVDEALHRLNESNKGVLNEVENIQYQTMQTNESVEKILKAVTLISVLTI